MSANVSVDLTTGTAQRYLLDVPLPHTRLSAGQHFGDTNHSGVSVHTDQHVRFYAKGSDPAASDLVAQAVGQVWIQSLEKLVGFAGKDVVIASPTSTTVVAEGGITVMSGFSPGAIASETTPNTFPSGIESYEAKAAIATGIWVIFDTVMAVTITAVSVALTLMDGALDRWGYEGAAANLAGASVNLAGLSFIPWSANVSLPGINLFSQAGTLIGAALGAVNIIGLPGTLIASTFTTQFGVLTAGVRGLFSCSMNALGPVDVTALADVTVRGSGGVTVAARAGTATLRGAKMTLGTEIPAWVLLPQMATTQLEMKAFESVALSSKGSLSVEAMKGVKSTAGCDTTFEGTALARFKSGPFEIKVSPESVQVGQPAGPYLKFQPTGVTLFGPGKAAKGKMAPGKVDLAAGPAKLAAVPSASLKVSGLKIDLQ